MTRPPNTPNRKSNRSHILDTALELFNENTTGGVSTNHISAKLGISPGNLYYHFKNKEDIILELFENFKSEYRDLFGGITAENPLLGLMSFTQSAMELDWKYRFFARELHILIRSDERLAASFRLNYQTRSQMLHEMLGILEKQGYIKPDFPLSTEVIRLSWLFHHFWLPFTDLEGTDTKPDINACANLLHIVYYPMLTEKAIQTLNEISTTP
ncbi:TetR/AcrR family transcriptional regulator [Myxococcota bacterium]|nr:TetR/AcrR family transcriptional regulator [Myxococcota bacterium]MBU1382846.1 TetR/AcrR family transcriptional regulator [Myxococcota bacterium]MBU1498995.1 TetR/AcrR family transcriptional regulator [Myxococcota bacterium]